MSQTLGLKPPPKPGESKSLRPKELSVEKTAAQFKPKDEVQIVPESPISLIAEYDYVTPRKVYVRPYHSMNGMPGEVRSYKDCVTGEVMYMRKFKTDAKGRWLDKDGNVIEELHDPETFYNFSNPEFRIHLERRVLKTEREDSPQNRFALRVGPHPTGEEMTIPHDNQRIFQLLENTLCANRKSFKGQKKERYPYFYIFDETFDETQKEEQHQLMGEALKMAESLPNSVKYGYAILLDIEPRFWESPRDLHTCFIELATQNPEYVTSVLKRNPKEALGRDAYMKYLQHFGVVNFAPHQGCRIANGNKYEKLGGETLSQAYDNLQKFPDLLEIANNAMEKKTSGRWKDVEKFIAGELTPVIESNPADAKLVSEQAAIIAKLQRDLEKLKQVQERQAEDVQIVHNNVKTIAKAKKVTVVKSTKSQRSKNSSGARPANKNPTPPEEIKPL